MSRRQVVLAVLDGVGFSDNELGNAVKAAATPNLDKLIATSPHLLIHACGKYVGLPFADNMGNSEVGHNALGSGQIYSQGASLVNDSLNDGSLYKGKTWQKIINYTKNHTLHLLGLLSDGNVHSHIDHCISLIKQAKIDGIKTVRLHILLDGRDVEARSALKYISQIEAVLQDLNDASFDGQIASGGGRMYLTMDRYQADWKMVERGYNAHVLGEGRCFNSAQEAVETYYKEDNCIDQDLKEFVIVKKNKPVGLIKDHDSVIFFNFRGDRALEITQAFEDPNFDKFKRKLFPEVLFVGMLQYDGDLLIPRHYLVEPPKIKNTLTEVLLKHNLKQCAISETQKYGHVTYFWNGNRLEKFNNELETWIEIPSDSVPFSQRPWMKSAEITDAALLALQSQAYDFIRINYPNGDMVGHTGDFQATVIALEAVDLALGRLIEEVKKENAILIVLADHGNADAMLEKDGLTPKTSHTLSLVPFILYNTDSTLKSGDFGLANVAATVCDLLNIDPHPNFLPSLIYKK